MSVFDGKTVAFVGGGMMGTAMLSGILKNEMVTPEQVTVADIDADRGQVLVDEYGVNFHHV